MSKNEDDLPRLRPIPSRLEFTVWVLALQYLCQIQTNLCLNKHILTIKPQSEMVGVFYFVFYSICDKIISEDGVEDPPFFSASHIHPTPSSRRIVIYQYRCPEHGLFDHFGELFNPNPTAICPQCRRICQKVISLPIIRFVGSGWTFKDRSDEFEQRFPDLARMAGE